MDKLQTSIEWLQQKYDNCPESFLTDDDFEQAKEMHKQEIKEAYIKGREEHYLDYYPQKHSEEYYQETFK
jgi:hypothetical protein